MRQSLFILVFGPLVAFGQAPSLHDQVQKAVLDGKFIETDMGQWSRPSLDVAQNGGVLVGFNVGLGKERDQEYPYALEPIYRSGDREWTGPPMGNMKSKWVVRQVREVARPGYSVAGVWVRSDTSLDRVRVQYCAVRDGRLDPSETYRSGWIGTASGGHEEFVGGRGRPIVGMQWSRQSDQVTRLGLVTVPVAPHPPKPKDALPPPPAVEKPARAAGADGLEVIGPLQGKSKLEEEAEAARAAKLAAEAGDTDNSALILAVVATAIIVPMFLASYLFLGGNKQSTAKPSEDERAALPVRRDRPDWSNGGPDAPSPEERPNLRARLDGRRTPDPQRDAKAEAANNVLSAAESARPPYFTVRAIYKAKHNRMMRVYVTAQEILVIDAGAGGDMNVTANVVATAAVGGGLVGALIGHAVGSFVADRQKESGDRIQMMLNRLDLRGLREWAETEKGNFRADLKELSGIEFLPQAPRKWYQEKTRAIAQFRFYRSAGGKGSGSYAFEFLSAGEMVNAAELLRQATGHPSDEEVAAIRARLGMG